MVDGDPVGGPATFHETSKPTMPEGATCKR
jgi:hypothetical protein